MTSLGFKLFKDPDLNYELVAGDLKIALNSISQQTQTVTVYFGAWDDYDPALKKYTRTKITLGENDTFLWTLVRMVDDGQGGQIEEQAVNFVSDVSVISPDEDDVTDLNPNNNIANFYYVDGTDNHTSTTNDHTLQANFNIGEFKYGWSTAGNVTAGAYRLAKRDPMDINNEIIMTREIFYGGHPTHEDRFMLFNHGDDIPADDWYVKDFWAYTYPNANDDVTQANDIIPRMKTLQSGVANKVRMDITFGIPSGYTGSNQDFNFRLKVFGLKNVLVEKVEL